MDYMQTLSSFRFYGIEVFLLALGVAVVSSLLKKTVLKNISQKAYVFLPFALGLVFYTVFRMIVTTSFAPIISETGATVNGGFACGSAATLYFVLWEQYIRKEALSPLYPLLFGFVKEEARKELADKLYEECISLEEEELLLYLSSALEPYYADGVTEMEKTALLQLLKAFVLSLRQKTE